MKCAFYRPEEINVEEFNNIVNGLKKDCVFRPDLDTHSGKNWTVIPVFTGHPFRS